MPDYEVIVGGKPRRIELTRKSLDSFEAKVDGKARVIKLLTAGIVLGKAFMMEIDGEAYKVELPEAEKGKGISVKVEGAAFDVGVKIASRGQALTAFEPGSQMASQKTVAHRKAAVEGAVVAPMTGKLVKVKVKKGDQVKAGQILCVIEAMKMENEICAPRAGTVQDVNIAEGTPVNEGETLLVIA